MAEKKSKKKFSKKMREIFVKVGSSGGKTTAKKLGKKGMSDLGKKGAEKRWGKKEVGA